MTDTILCPTCGRPRAEQRPSVPVARRALTARINRRLRDQGPRLRAAQTRAEYDSPDHGPLALVDLATGNVARPHVDLASIAAELHCVRAWEVIS